MIGRHVVVFQSLTRVDDEGGGYEEVWVDAATVRATVEPLEGFEQIQAMQTGMQRPYRIKTWYRQGIGGATRAVYKARGGDRVLNIRSVIDPGERHRKLSILADEAAP